ncbi:unnamed protein product [Bemisia tabaci]|uniref:Vacuolar ATPase assembly protein VMA22 n=1 Tax=Bemisia tabaci TaxID=7038 RepID=A0A9P0A5V5_BEMTA|nr:unnamed protein product [Bemisia tabaci]
MDTPDMKKDPAIEDLNTELDKLGFKVLQLMNDYIKSKVQLEQTIKNGCLDLAKARYIRGGAAISSLQLPTEDSLGVKALAKVEAHHERTDGCTSFSLLHFEPTISNKKSTDSETDSYTDGDKSCLDSEKITDPLKWFGVLVPQNLRQAQAWFKQSIELAVDCTNIQASIQHKREEFLRLLKLKRSLISAESEFK